jgi:hypothetical protein
MIIVAISKTDGHIYQSNPAGEDKDTVINNIVLDMTAAGLIKDTDYTIVEKTDTEFEAMSQ